MNTIYTGGRTRGINDTQSYMFTYISPEERVPGDHPLRTIKTFADAALKELSPVFNEMYSRMGRPSIPPERLLKAQILIALYSVRSDRLFTEMLNYNILFRWFLDMNLEEPSLDATTFTKNRDRLLEHNVALKFFDKVVGHARKEGLLSDEHFTVDGTLIEACASMNSFRPKDEDPSDRPTTDPDALLMRKGLGKEAKLSYSAHALMENRNGILVDPKIDQATGKSERQAVLAMLGRQRRKRVKPKTLRADKGYDTEDFVERIRDRNITPHITANVERRRGSTIDGRTARHMGYSIGQRIRKRVEGIFGWLKTVGGFRRTRFKGRDRTELQALIIGTAYNLMRITRLIGKGAAVV